jgi:hypothetical protein
MGRHALLIGAQAGVNEKFFLNLSFNHNPLEAGKSVSYDGLRILFIVSNTE